jgi:Ca2+-transporting ATPase
MRDLRSRLVVNEVTRNGWLWGALLLCAALLAAPPYLPPAAHLLQLAPLTADMWSIVLTFSLAPLIVTQATMVVVSRWHAKAR